MKEKILNVIKSCKTMDQLESARRYLLLATQKQIPGINECWRYYIEHRRRIVFAV